MTRRLLSLGMVVVLIGCVDAREDPPSAAAPAAATGTGPETGGSDTMPPIIAPDGIGAARVGYTLAEARRHLPAGYRLGDLDTRFMVDLNAVPVIAGTDTLYYLAVPLGESLADSSRIRLVITLHALVRTAEGVGPGVTLAEAATRYGPATLRYSVHDEMREYASFADYPHGRIRFRVAPGDHRLLAGRYATEGEYNETSDYDGSARIGMVLVNLDSDQVGSGSTSHRCVGRHLITTAVRRGASQCRQAAQAGLM